MHDYFSILGLSYEASDQEVKAAYKQQALRHHPDKAASSDEAALSRFQLVHEAYEVLSNVDKRREHLRQLATSMVDRYVLPPPMPRARESNGIGREDVHVVIRAGLPELYHGGRRKVVYCRRRVCSGCEGRGGFDVRVCPDCGGRGKTKHRGRCETCRGGKTVAARACRGCAGTGHVERQEEVEVAWQPGERDVVVPEAGHRYMTPEGLQFVGRLVVSLQPVQHPVFSFASGLGGHDDLEVLLSVDLVDALCGVRVLLPHVDGGYVSIDTYNSIIDPDRVIVVEGRGMLGENGRRGDLYVTFKIRFPREIRNAESVRASLSRELQPV